MRINDLIAEITEINTANGWRERDLEPLDEGHPKAQIAAMTQWADYIRQIVEAIRTRWRDPDELARLFFGVRGIGEEAGAFLAQVREYGEPAYGSRTEAICRARLIDTETCELTAAILEGNVQHVAEELADIVIRVLDFVGAWNEAYPDQPIDLEAAIRAKLDRNRTRGYRQGGKLA